MPLVAIDPDIMGGEPCFAGSRVPIDIVLGCLEAGEERERVFRSYPFLTDAHIVEARRYAALHPAPKRIMGLTGGTTAIGRRTIRPGPR